MTSRWLRPLPINGLCSWQSETYTFPVTSASSLVPSEFLKGVNFPLNQIKCLGKPRLDNIEQKKLPHTVLYFESILMKVNVLKRGHWISLSARRPWARAFFLYFLSTCAILMRTCRRPGVQELAHLRNTKVKKYEKNLVVQSLTFGIPVPRIYVVIVHIHDVHSPVVQEIALVSISLRQSENTTILKKLKHRSGMNSLVDWRYYTLKILVKEVMATPSLSSPFLF